MKKLFSYFSLIIFNFFIFKAEGVLVNRDTFFEYVMGVPEALFKDNQKRIKDSRPIWNIDQKLYYLKNPKTGQLFRAGEFKQLNIANLRDLTVNKKVSSTPGQFNVIEALSPVEKSYYKHVDIGANQAKPENRDAVFQVASNFNALELTSPNDLMSGLETYIYDKTQGPFASISAAPGTILRHYYMFYDPTTEPFFWRQQAIPNKIWQQNDNKTQINLLEKTDIPIVNSYVAFDKKNPDQVKNYKVEDIEVGWHEGIQVTSGLMPNFHEHTLVNDPDQIINQVFTAAVDFGSNSAYADDPTAIAITQAIQDAAYEGTIRAAVAHNKKKVILTLIGGGVFYNKLAWMASALEKMKDFIISSGIDVTLIIFDGNDGRLEDQIDEFRARMQKLVQDTGGKYVQYSNKNPEGKILTTEKVPAKVTPQKPAEVTQPSEAKKTIDRSTFFEYIMGVKENDFQKDDNLKKNSIKWGRFGSSTLTNSNNKQSFNSGQFKTFSIGELRNLTSKTVSSSPGNFNIVEALDPLGKSYYKYVDISTLQADQQNLHAVFQVISSTNALELTSQSDLMGNITSYIHNPTQGPAASVSAAPGLILRHYYMFYDSKTPPSSWQQQAVPNKIWEKSDAKKQLNLLENTDIPVVNSYIALDEKDITQIKNYKIEDIKIGWHKEIQVTFVPEPNTNQYTLVKAQEDRKQIISQVFTAALDFETNYSYRNNPTTIAIAQALQDAAYEGTIRAAVAHNITKVYLTLLGSATFSNKLSWIANALEKMKDFIINSGINVTLIIFNGNDPRLVDQIDEFRIRMQKLVQDTGGQYIQYSKTNPMGKILVASKTLEKPEEQPTKNIIDALHNLTGKLQNVQNKL